MSMKYTHTAISMITCLLLITSVVGCSQGTKQQSQLPIIDMHSHALVGSLDWFSPKDFYGIQRSETGEELLKARFELYRKYNIVKVALFGDPNTLEVWKSKDEGDLFIPGLYMSSSDQDGMTPERFEELVKSGKIEIFGEIIPMSSGTTISDPEWQPYLKICEQYDVPCSVHTGQEWVNYHLTWPKIRLALGDPYLIEDILKRYPKLRVYISHAGFEWYEHAAVLMFVYPNLYTDLGWSLYGSPMVRRFAKEFLIRAQEGKFLDRVMFGTDSIAYPHGIGMSIEYLNSLEFLSEKDKRDILYNNAARFLRLEEE